MAKETKEVAQTSAVSNLPAHLQGGKTHKIGNVDSTDRILPRIKLLHGVNPELDAYNNAKKGEFWHNVASEPLGTELRGVPIIMRKSYSLWAPRGDDRMVLARANDAIHWDQPVGTKFEVKPKNSPHKVVYELGETVHTRINGQPALSEFGSSIPGDPNSPPAAALTYQFLWWFPDHPRLSPAVIINTRSAVKAAKDLLSKIDLRPVEHFGQVYKIGVTKQKNGAGEEFYNYFYVSDGYADEKDYNICKDAYEQYQKVGWRADDEGEDTDGDGLDNQPSGNAKGGKQSDKF